MNIKLRPFKDSDIDVLYKWINNRDLMLNNSNYIPISESEHSEWFESILKQKNNYQFIIESVNDNKPIGTCQLSDVNFIHRTAELKIRIGESSYLGKGFGTEAVKALVRFGFIDLNLNRIYLQVFESNARAIKSYKKCNFKIEGTMNEAAYICGEYLNIVIMGLLRSDF